MTSMQKSSLNCAVNILSFKSQVHEITPPVLNLCRSEFIVTEKILTNTQKCFLGHLFIVRDSIRLTHQSIHVILGFIFIHLF